MPSLVRLTSPEYKRFKAKPLSNSSTASDEFDRVPPRKEIQLGIGITAEKRLTTEYVDPKIEDILFGPYGSNPGNVRLREMAKRYGSFYAQAQKGFKSKIATGIVYSLRNANQPSRFLKRCPKSNKWYEVSDKEAATKVKRALRDNFNSRVNDENAPPQIKNVQQETVPQKAAAEDTVKVRHEVAEPPVKSVDTSKGGDADSKSALKDAKENGSDSAKLSDADRNPKSFDRPDINTPAAAADHHSDATLENRLSKLAII